MRDGKHCERACNRCSHAKPCYPSSRSDKCIQASCLPESVLLAKMELITLRFPHYVLIVSRTIGNLREISFSVIVEIVSQKAFGDHRISETLARRRPMRAQCNANEVLRDRSAR